MKKKNLLIGILSSSMILAGVGAFIGTNAAKVETTNTYDIRGNYSLIKRVDAPAEYSGIRYLKSVDKTKALLVTAFNDDVLALADGKDAKIGFEVNSTKFEGTTYYGGISTKKTAEADSKVWLPEDIFGASFAGYHLIVEEIDFDRATAYTIKSYFEVDGNVEKSKTSTLPVDYSYSNLWDCSTFTSTEEEPYEINSEADLVKLRDVSRSGTAEAQVTFAGTYFKLTKDLTMTTQWTCAIGANATNSTFKGTFDGGNHSITNLEIVKENGCTALFGNAVGATIKNLKLINGKFESTSSVSATAQRTAGFVGRAENITLENLVFESGSVKGTVENGGIVGVVVNGGTIKNCVNKASIECTGTSIGGIVGKLYSGNCTVTGCTNYGNVISKATGDNYLGGIVGNGASAGTVSIKDCTNEGEIEAKGTGNTFTGGIIGANVATSAYTIEGCVNEGYVKTAGAYCGGVIGLLRKGTVKECTAAADVTCSANKVSTGAIAGETRGAVVDCIIKNSVKVNGSKPTKVGLIGTGGSESGTVFED